MAIFLPFLRGGSSPAVVGGAGATPLRARRLKALTAATFGLITRVLQSAFARLAAASGIQMSFLPPIHRFLQWDDGKR